MFAKKAPLLRLLAYAKSHKSTIRRASVFSVLNKIFDLAPPLLIGAAVDIVVQREHSFFATLGMTSLNGQLALLAGLTVLIWGLESLFEFAFQIYWRNLSQTLQHELRLDTWRHLQNLDLAFFETRTTGGIMAILNDDVNQLERFLDGGANSLIQMATTVVIIGGIFCYFSPLVALLAMLPTPFIILGAFRFQNRIAPLYVRVREKVSLLNSRLSNSLGSVVTVKSYTAEAWEVERLREQSEDYKFANRRAITQSSAFVPLIRMVILLGFTATLVVGGWLSLNGRLEVGAYSVLVFLTQRLLWPLTGLAEVVDLYQRAMASTTRVLDLMDTPFGIRSGERGMQVQQGGGEIVFERVNFAYESGFPVLQDLSFTIPAGKTLGVVGSTGSGKTTLAKLLLRFYDPQSGGITIDGLDLREVDLDDLRRHVGLVSQDVFLFHGTVSENIAYGSFSASDDEIRRAAQWAEADEFIRALPNGYQTMVGERGQKLSGGQRQRLSIARAILKNPPILILDEATSAVDNETEAAIQRSLDRISKGRTMIAIAHRLSTVRNAHRILVLDQGRLVERGDHESLLAENGVYARLWNIQTGRRTEGIGTH